MLVPEEVILVGKVPISVDDMQRLADLGWLTDNIINAYAQLLQREVDDGSTTYLSTFLYTNLMLGKRRQYSFDAVQHWTRNRDVFTSSRICVPINHAGHWSIAVVVPATFTVYHFDSIPGTAAGLGRTMVRWAGDASKQAGRPARSWTLRVGQSWQQPNSHDCGVFVCSVMHQCLRGNVGSAGTEPTPDFRAHIMGSLKAGRVVHACNGV